MAFRTILAVTGPHEGDGDLKPAADLCNEIGAYFAVLVVAVAAPPPVGEYAAVVSEAWLDERRAVEDLLKKRTADLSAFLADSVLSADVSSEYPEAGWADDTIGRRARYADITVIGPELLANETLKSKAIEGALFSSGKPLLLIPAGAQPTLKPKRVLIAWDARLEASRAVRESLGLLPGADEVHLVMVDPVEDEYRHGGRTRSRRRRLSRAAWRECHSRPAAQPGPFSRRRASPARARHRRRPDGDGRLRSFPVARAHLRWRHRLDA